MALHEMAYPMVLGWTLAASELGWKRSLPVLLVVAVVSGGLDLAGL